MAEATCDTCQMTGTVGDGINQLAELGFGASAESQTIHLCDTCLDRRETRNWPLAASEGKRIYDALHEKKQAPSRRYSYLMEPEERIHLVRLRPDWVDRHAAEA